MSQRKKSTPRRLGPFHVVGGNVTSETTTRSPGVAIRIRSVGDLAYARGGPRYRISVERRSGTTLAVLFVAAMTVATAACASVAPSASLTPVSIAIPPSSSAAAPSPVPTAGGCGETVVYAPPGPDSAGRGLDAQPWAPASPRSAGVLAYLWGQPPVFLHVDPPVGTSNKVLWDTRGDIGDHLEIVAHRIASRARLSRSHSTSLRRATRSPRSSICRSPVAGTWICAQVP